MNIINKITKACLWGFMLSILLLSTACQRDNGAVMLNINVAPMAGSDKMVVTGKTACWTAGDSVWVNGLPYPVNTAGGYSITVAYDQNGYRAVSPASIVNGGTTINLPAKYHYRTNNSGDQLLSLPLAAYSDGNNLLFKHLTGALVVKLRNDTSINLTIDHVTIRSNGYAISGARTINFNDIAASTTARDGNGNDTSVTMYFDRQEVTLTPNETVYVMIPVAAVGDANKFTIEVSTHNQGERIVFRRTQDSTHIFSCNTFGYATMALSKPALRQSNLFTHEGSGSLRTWQITNEEEFKLMVTAINSGWTFEGNKYSTFRYRITNPIDFGGDTIETIRHYRGASFNGGSNPLSNLKIISDKTCCALFDTITDDNRTSISGILLNNITLISDGRESNRFISPIIGHSSGQNSYSNCTINKFNTIIKNSPSGNIYFGGIVAATGSSISFNNCHFNGDVTLSSNGKIYYGGLLGAMLSTNPANCTITSCSNTDTNRVQLTATGNIYAGGLIGEAKKYSNTITNQTCLIKISLETNSNYTIYAGGLIGYLNSTSSNINMVSPISIAGYITYIGNPRTCYIGTIFGLGKISGQYGFQGQTSYDISNFTYPSPDTSNNIYTGDPSY